MISFIAVTALVAAVAISGPVGSGSARSLDSTPPTLNSVSISPSSVDVTTGSATVLLTANITDDSSGVSYAAGCTQGGIEQVASGQVVSGSFQQISGDTYGTLLTIPQGAAAGAWRLRYMTLCDKAGNQVFLATSNGNLPFALNLNVIDGVSDSTPPTLNSISVSPSSVDVTNGPATVTLTAKITDDISGVSYAGGCTQGGIEQVSSGQVVSGTFQHVSGDTYTTTLTLSQGAAAGAWRLRYVTLCDNAGNRASLFTANGNLLFAVNLNVIDGVSDSTPPTLNSISIRPSSVDVSTGPATVTLTANITDDASGVNAGGCTQGGIEQVSSGQIVAGSFQHVSGDTYATSLTVPQGAAAGAWRLRYVTLCDNAGNQISMAAANGNLLFAVNLDVTSSSGSVAPLARGASTAATSTTSAASAASGSDANSAKPPSPLTTVVQVNGAATGVVRRTATVSNPYPLLSTALSRALKRTLMVPKNTVCVIDGQITACKRLYSTISNHRVKVVTLGKAAQRITVLG